MRQGKSFRGLFFYLENMPLEIKIEKKNGSVEGFNPEKIIRAVRLAGDRIGRILSTEQLN